jgi:hypothetical protein
LLEDPRDAPAVAPAARIPAVRFRYSGPEHWRAGIRARRCAHDDGSRCRAAPLSGTLRIGCRECNFHSGEIALTIR